MNIDPNRSHNPTPVLRDHHYVGQRERDRQARWRPITSDLHTAGMAANQRYNTAIDAIESLILAHACCGRERGSDGLHRGHGNRRRGHRQPCRLKRRETVTDDPMATIERTFDASLAFAAASMTNAATKEQGLSCALRSRRGV